GINVQRMIVLAFVISSALAGLGGILIAPITFAWAYMGTVPGIKDFSAPLFGGLENPIGILIGGLVIGLLEQLFGIINSNLKEGITFLVILLILALRPTGLMGKKEIEKVWGAPAHTGPHRSPPVGRVRRGGGRGLRPAPDLRRFFLYPRGAGARLFFSLHLSA